MFDNKTIVTTFVDALGRGETECLKTLMTDDIAVACTGTPAFSAAICAAAALLKAATADGIVFTALNLTPEEDRVASETRARSILHRGAHTYSRYDFLSFLRGGRIFLI